MLSILLSNISPDFLNNKFFHSLKFSSHERNWNKQTKNNFAKLQFFMIEKSHLALGNLAKLVFWSILRPQTAQLFIVSVSLVSRRSQYVNLCWKFSNFQVQRSQTLWDFSYNAKKSLWLARRHVRLKPHWWSTIQVTKKCSKETSVTFSTGKSLSEALILGSTNPQYDKRLFIDLPVQCFWKRFSCTLPALSIVL